MDELELDVDTAIPISMIVNELLTNALKYAFPKEQNSINKIKLTEEDDDLQLQVQDNGIEKIKNLTAQGAGFSTQLISLLTMQLDGTMEERVENGTLVSFRFSKAWAAWWKESEVRKQESDCSIKKLNYRIWEK